MNDDHAAIVAQTLDAAVFAVSVIDEDAEASVAILKHAEKSDMLGIITSLITLITENLGDDGARDYFEAVRKCSVTYEATGRAPMPRMRHYIEDDGIDDGLAADAAELIDMAVRGHDIDARAERVLKWASPAAIIAELASAAAVLATRFGEDDWYTATRAANRAAGLP